MTSGRLTYAHRNRGLDHDWFQHRPTHTRPPLRWPQGKPIALWIAVPVEYFPMDASGVPVRPLGGLDRGYPDFWSYSNRDYGLRIGIYRIMRVLDGLGLRATAVVSSEVATRYSRIIDEIALCKWEIAAGGVDMGHVHHGKLARDEERALIAKARETLTAASGQRIRGWHSPGHSQSAATLELLAACGLDYVMDWANDDMPFAMHTASGPLCAMPLTHEWSDRLLLAQHPLTVEDYEAQVLRAFDRLRAEAARHESGRILSLSVTPWILGYPHRIATLERLLKSVLDTGAAWNATGAEIVDQFTAQTPAGG